MAARISNSHVPYLQQLETLLDDVVYDQAGPDAALAVRHLRQLATERRSGMPDAEERLVAALAGLSDDISADVIRAFTMYFDLANLAEELHRIRILRKRTREAGSDNRQRETIFNAIESLRQRNFSASDVQRLIDNLKIEPVFTAHPSEAKRRTTRALLRRMRETLAGTAIDETEEMALGIRRALRADLTALWQSDLLRPTRPNVMSEVERGLFFASTMRAVVPQIAGSLRDALAFHYPNDRFDVSPPVRFGTWIGGDRDGHPFVTTEVTDKALDMMRDTAIDGYLEQCRSLMTILVMSDRHTAGLSPLTEAVQAAVANNPDLAEHVDKVSATEVPHQWLKVIEQRLIATGSDRSKLAYKSPGELEADVELLIDVLTNCRSQDVVEMYVRPWLDSIQTFGLTFASMDIRQHSGMHETVVADVLRRNNICDNYAALNDAERIRCLVESLQTPVQLQADDYAADVAESLALFQLLVRRIQSQGPETFGGYVVSMTHSASDIVCVFWLWTQVWRSLTKSDDPPFLAIAPLFETIEDLEHAPSIMESLWQIPAYRTYLRQSKDDSQLVMVGYSDSTKDGGYLSASWKLHQSQTQLTAVAKAHGIRLIVFHGRGGALGRGGGPAARAVLSLPPSAVNGAMRVTEQGEILAERYDNPEIAQRHLEQVTWATLLVSSEDAPDIPEEYEAKMTAMADHSFSHYRQLVTHAEFLKYFDFATPISEIETLPIGSRPSRRKGERSLSDLRAIPWTFGWTQSRHLIPAWYGLGTALRTLVDEANGDWSVLRKMYAEWRFFAAIIDNAELALAKTDLDIARRYSQLCPADVASGIWPLIEEEFHRSRATVLVLKQQDDLLDETGWLQKSIRHRNPSIDPLNLLQIRLLSESRADRKGQQEPGDDAESVHLLRLTINGIAAGMRTTG